MSGSLDDQTAHAKVCSRHHYEQQKLMKRKILLNDTIDQIDLN
jgi:hypothetical protein